MLQEKIIESLETGRETLIYGSPGTGKTQSMVEVIKYLIMEKKAKPEELLVFCFNRRWSKIIRERTTELINKSIFEIPAETFYSFSIDLIERSKTLTGREKLEAGKNFKKNSYASHADMLLLNEVEVINSTQQWQLLKNIVRNLNRNDYPLTTSFINKNPNALKSFFQEIFDYILRAQENLFTPEQLLKKITPYNNPVLSELSGIYYRYIDNLRERDLFNYGMLLQEAVNILKTNKTVNEYYNNKYKFIIIDELNEINKAQFEIIKQMPEPCKIFFGNDDESIFAFRGSFVRYFKETYLKINPVNKILLKDNHRSVPLINNICSKLIMKNNDRIQKEAESIIKAGSKENVIIKEFSNSLEETEFISSRIEYLEKVKGINLEDMAVIIKGLGYETYLVENSLKQKGIPYYRRDSRSLLDNNHVRYMINFSRLVLAVSEHDTEVKLLNNPVNFNSGIEALIDKILVSEVIALEPLYYKKLKECFIGKKEIQKDLNMWDFLIETRNADQRILISEEENYNKITGFLNAASDFMKIIHLEVLEFLFELLKDRRIGPGYFLSEVSEEEEREAIWTNIGDFLKNVYTFSKNCNECCNIASYINFIDDLIENQFLEEIEESTEELCREGKVNILSFHHCKGLEFEAVFIPFMNKNYLPAKFELPQIFEIQLFEYLRGVKKLEENQLKSFHREGELRLFYNGLSRAGKYLHVTSDSSKEKSVFFEDLKIIYRSLIDNPDYSNAAGQKDLTRKSNNGSDQKSGYGFNIVSDKPWLLKKKSMVSLVRLEHKLKVDFENFFKKLIVLKTIYPERKWWSSIESTKNSNVLFKTGGRKSFSFSEINCYKSCPFRYKISYLFNIKEEENLNIIIGKLYHHILGLFFSPGAHDYSWERLESIIEEQFLKQCFDFDSLKSELKEKALSEFKNFYVNFLPANPSSSVVEKKFSFGIKNNEICDNEIVINGRIDQINLIGKNKIEVVDYKSSSRIFSEMDIREELQLKLYRTAFDLSDDLLKYRGSDISMKYIILGNLKNTLVAIPEEHYDPPSIIENVCNILKGINEENFDPNPENYFICQICDFKILCPRFYGPN